MMAATRFFNWYQGRLLTRPILTKSCTAFCTSFLGDSLSQYISEKSHHLSFWVNWNIKRSLKVGFYGFAYLAPLLHYYFGFMNKICPARTLIPIVKKLLFDQTISTCYIISSFFVINTLLMGGTLQQAKDKVRHNLWTALQQSWKIWPFVMFLNYTFVPLHFQVLLNNTVSIFWSAYMSYLTNYKHKHIFDD